MESRHSAAPICAPHSQQPWYHLSNGRIALCIDVHQACEATNPSNPVNCSFHRHDCRGTFGTLETWHHRRAFDWGRQAVTEWGGLPAGASTAMTIRMHDGDNVATKMRFAADAAVIWLKVR